MEPRESALWRGTSELSGGAQSGHFAWVRPRRPGARWDTLLEVESLSVSGLTLGDLLDLLDHCEDPIRIRTAGAGIANSFTHTLTHTHTRWFLWFTGTFHRRNGLYTVQAVCAIAQHLPYT